MTFPERYRAEDTWFGKVMVMEIFHLAMTHSERRWTLTKTAKEFDCSIGLVSENLRLAVEIHINSDILKCQTRQEALNKMVKLR